MDDFSKQCKCGKIQLYKNKKNLDQAIKNNTECQSCSSSKSVKGKWLTEYDLGTRKRMEAAVRSLELIRCCPSCTNPIRYKTKTIMIDCARRNTSCRICNRKKQLPVKHTEQTKLRLRQLALERIKHNVKGCIAYNVTACKFFDALNTRFGWNGQHALNKGEKQILGYSLDYYVELPKSNSILIIEWDEAHHLKEPYRSNDIQRQLTIESSLGDRCIFLRWNEKEGKWHAPTPMGV